MGGNGRDTVGKTTVNTYAKERPPVKTKAAQKPSKIAESIAAL